MDKMTMMNQDVIKLVNATADTLVFATFEFDDPAALRQMQITIRGILLLVEYNEPRLDPDTAKRLADLKAFANKVI